MRGAWWTSICDYVCHLLSLVYAVLTKCVSACSFKLSVFWCSHLFVSGFVCICVCVCTGILCISVSVSWFVCIFVVCLYECVAMSAAAFMCLCIYISVCVITVTMADSPDWYNQTTVNLAALHVSPEPKTGHKPSTPYPWTPTLTRPIQQELTAPVHPRQAMIANCFFPLSVYPHFSFHPSLLPSLPSSSSLFIEPRPPRDIPFGWQPF